MATPNPFLQFAPNRAKRVHIRLNESLWLESQSLAVTAARPTAGHRPLEVAKKERRSPIKSGEAWGKLYDQRWFHIEIPAPPKGKAKVPRFLEWSHQGESTLYVDGVPYYGFDDPHRAVVLPPGVREVWIEGYCCNTFSHPSVSPNGSIFNGASLKYRDETVWDCLQEMNVMFDVMMALRSRQEPKPAPFVPMVGLRPKVDDASPIYRKVLHIIERACDAYELDGPAAMSRILVEGRAELKSERPLLTGILHGHAHIDLVWLWPERMGEAKAVHTFSTMNRLMERYPEFRFSYSQPASYRAVERRAPQLAAQVKQHIARGAWEATGALDVESDTLLACGEALARSFMLGQAEFARLRGARGPAQLVWLPDVFGYSACLPQLMRLVGVEQFFTTKLTWNTINRFPYSSFVWRGNDGSEVVSHVTQNVGYNNGVGWSEVESNARGHSQSHLHREFLHPTGFGDGGGGTTEEQLERARRLSGLCDLPELRWDLPENFFERLAKLRAQLPVHQGECYLEHHRGIYTTHGDFKAIFRGTERALQVREAVAAATGEVPDLVAPWRRLVFAQFHDFVPGSAIAEVYAEGRAELSRITSEQLEAARNRLSTSGLAVAKAKKSAAAKSSAAAEEQLFNPLALPWRGWVGERWYELPPLASVPAEVGATAGDEAQATASIAKNGAASLRSDRVQARVTRDGRLAELVIDGRPITFSETAATAVLYPDNPGHHDAWDIDRHSLELGKPVTTPVTITVEHGLSEPPTKASAKSAAKSRDTSTAVASASAPAHAAAICVRRKLGKASELVLRYEVRAGEPVLRLTADVDWHETRTLLRLHFPTEYRGRFARFGGPFGSVLRGQQPGEPITEAQWEVPGSRWATVSLDSEREGLALITEAKYGFSARDGELTVSLLRGAETTCAIGEYGGAAPPHLSRYQPESPFTDQGRHTIALALTSYSADLPQEQHPAVLADTLFTPPVAYRGAPASAGLLGVHDAPTLVPAWAMPVAKDAWVLRLHEVGGARGTARIDLAEGFVACPATLHGDAQGKPLKDGALDYAPYKILSMRIERTKK
ncbi:hypothetical protein AXK11_00080 [Cephaloticoccus primus]|uniref:Glycoside hydrolase family 38 central domain-containing protein n=1 Tax=Cephaloticoccus primus TaxID=1548207 RepID=A0A139SSX6_9BACT|nr:alpha-mannosidase [Cephaloticoccus primus]KXU37673.1 hypothetical protein AXK11_00080 [Cephaloticoccus primus]